MPHSDNSDKNPEPLRSVIARVALKTGELDLADELSETATIIRPAKYTVPGQDGDAQLIDQDDDGTETFRWGDARIECKGKCGKWTHHDIYIEVEGLVQLKARTFATCRDCQHEQAGEVMDGIGDIEPRRLERIAAAATNTERNRRRARARAANKSKRRNR